MRNEIYRKRVGDWRNSPDGETATYVVVTEEMNGWAVFLENYNGCNLVRWHDYRTDAIEDGVDYGRKIKAAEAKLNPEEA